ncbi:MAG: hypothetical protein IKF51_07845 [Solobacterium sp.]|nr:hypothetical protein [Solobacterium sp.]
MTATWTLKEHSSGEMIVTVEGEAWQNAVENAFRKLSGKLEVKGFRKGQVPRKIAEKRISAAERQYEAVSDCVDEWLKAGLEETGVEPISQPMVDIKDINDDGVTLSFMFTVMPEVKLGAYKDIEYELEEVTVTPEEEAAELDRQRERFEGEGQYTVLTNARCSTAMIEKFAEPDTAGLQLLRDAAEKMKFSARGYHRVLKVARTLADLDDKPTVGRLHLAEAISYRIAGERLTAAA